MLKQVLVFPIFCVCVFAAPKDVVIKIASGEIQGNLMKSREGREFYAFRGVPYAKPPIGELRFKSPEPIDDWEGVYDATKDAPACLQKNSMFHYIPPIEGSEDCLYLNVYTPTLNITKKLPVIVQIHYGGFVTGNSKSTLIGPEYLLDKNVVYVSFNYRLGIFGFYTTLDDASPGNYGLKDQRLLLRWVQKNIAQFGGDPNLVTIIGMSAGAGSVHHHLLSPSSQGLFHRVVASSGSALAFWGHPMNIAQKDLFRPLANSSGCDSEANTTQIIECMRTVDAEVLVSAGDPFRYINNEPFMMFNLIQETKSETNPEPFLEEDPIEIIKKGKFNHVPFIMGVVPNEGIVRFGALIRRKELYDQVVKEFDVLGPKLVLEGLIPENQIDEVWKNMKNLYLGEGEETIDIKKPKTIQGFLDMFTDAGNNYGTYQSMLYHSYKGYKNLWMYRFEYEGQLSFTDAFSATNETVDFHFGVCHGDDYIYLFPAPDILPELPNSDLKMSKIMVEIWTHFAVHGEPPKLDKGPCTLDWKRIPSIKGKKMIKNEDLHYLRFSNSDGKCPVSMTMQKGFLKNRMNFFQNSPFPVQFQIKEGTWEK